VGYRWITDKEIEIARTMKRDHKLTWAEVGRIMNRNPSDLCMRCRPKDAKSFWISEDEVTLAKGLRAQGLTWSQIGQQLGRGDGTALCKRILGRRKARVTRSIAVPFSLVHVIHRTNNS
jgi:hypothetical protein